MEKQKTFCQEGFESKSKGFKRKSFDAALKGSNITVRGFLEKFVSRPVLSVNEFLCDSCWTLLSKIHYQNTVLQSNQAEFIARAANDFISGYHTYTYSGPMPKKARTCSPKKPFGVPERKGFSEKLRRAVINGNYTTALNIIYKRSKKGKKSVLHFLQTVCRKEVASFAKISQKKFLLSCSLTPETVETFSWAQAATEIHNQAPVLSTVIKSAVTRRNTQHKVAIEGKKVGPLVPGYGMLISMLLNMATTKKYLFLPQINSIQMFRAGWSQKLFGWFNKLGLCLSTSGTRSLVDRLGKDFDSEVLRWRENIESDLEYTRPVDQHVPQIEDTESDDSLESDTDVDESDPDTSHCSDDTASEESQMSSSDEEDNNIVEHPLQNTVYGYSLTWDNVMKLSCARHQSTRTDNKLMMWANCFATRNRISFHHLEAQDHLRQASDIDVENLLPGNNEYDLMRNRMEILVKRILIKNFQALQDIAVCQHIPHQYSLESSQKSDVINLGVVTEIPASCKGVLEVMKFLHQYVPLSGDDKPYSIIVNGDQLSVERMIDVQLSMAASKDNVNRLQGLVPRPQNFHKKCILLQDTMNSLYKGSPSEKGTLMNIRNLFGHRIVKKKINDCINHTVDFLNFTTEGYVCLLALHLWQVPSLDHQLSATEVDLTTLAGDIVKFIWPSQETTDENRVPRNEQMCWCDPDDEVQSLFTVECSSQDGCPNGQYFHDSCVGLDLDSYDAAEDWWCSQQCKDRARSAFCCHCLIPGETWVGCESANNCINGEWFHLSCKGLKAVPDNEWYCSADCEAGKKPKELDHVQEYSKSVTWRGLLHMVERDAERENDGPMMMTMWSINMIEFWEFNHYKYLILAHRLLISMQGWLPQRLRDEMTWNSTANLTGLEGHNSALDLLNEFLNNEFKANLKKTSGQYTDSTVDRCSRITGSLGKDMEVSFSNQIIQKYSHKSKSTRFDYKHDIQKFIAEYSCSNLFSYKAGRSHKSFPKHEHKIIMRKPDALIARLKRYSKELDKERNLLL